MSQITIDLPLLAPQAYQSQNRQLFVKLLITDNHAKTVEVALQQLGIPVTVERFIHWEIESNSDITADIIASGELLNTNKESHANQLTASADATLLVKERDDIVGQQKCQTLQHHFQLSHLNAIHHGIIWQLTFSEGDKAVWMDEVLKSHILFNPFAHEVFILA